MLPPRLLLNDNNAAKRLISEQAKQIECLKRQLEAALAASASPGSASSAYRDSAQPTPSASNTSTRSDTIVNEYKVPTLPFVCNNQLSSASPSVKSEERIELSSASPCTPQKEVLPPQRRLLPRKPLKLNQLPSKQTFKKRIKAALALDGYNRDVHFQHLIYQDSTLPPHTKNARWNFAFRFCSYLVLSDRKIFVRTLIHGNKRDNKKTAINSFPGLHAFLGLKRVDGKLLEKPLSEETAAYFTNTKHQLEIVKFMYAFCSLLYAFLPQEKRMYKVRSNVNEFYLTASAKTSDQAEEDEREIKEEMDSDPEFMESGSKTEDND